MDGLPVQQSPTSPKDLWEKAPFIPFRESHRRFLLAVGHKIPVDPYFNLLYLRCRASRPGCVTLRLEKYPCMMLAEGRGQEG